MAKIKLYPLYQGISGKVGNVVFRQTSRGEVIIARAPAKSKVKPSEAQNAHRQRFKQAVAYAKAALADPATRAHYAAAAARSDKTPYNLALSDGMKGKYLIKFPEPGDEQNSMASPIA